MLKMMDIIFFSRKRWQVLYIKVIYMQLDTTKYKLVCTLTIKNQIKCLHSIDYNQIFKFAYFRCKLRLPTD